MILRTYRHPGPLPAPVIAAIAPPAVSRAPRPAPVRRLPAALLNEIEAFLRASGMGASRFGREAIGDPRLVGKMRCGRVLRDATAERVRRFIREQSA